MISSCAVDVHLLLDQEAYSMSLYQLRARLVNGRYTDVLKSDIEMGTSAGAEI
jgi:hypothetical protein